MVHLIHASLRYDSRKNWLPLARDLRLVHTAAYEAAAVAALENSAATWPGSLPGDREAVAGALGG